MITSRKLAILLPVVLSTVVGTGPTWALTGAEVLDNMNDDARGGYLAGNIDMAAQLAYQVGDQERSRCIFDWYYSRNGVEQVVQAISRYRDRQVQPVIQALINRACAE